MAATMFAEAARTPASPTLTAVSLALLVVVLVALLFSPFVPGLLLWYRRWRKSR